MSLSKIRQLVVVTALFSLAACQSEEDKVVQSAEAEKLTESPAAQGVSDASEGLNDEFIAALKARFVSARPELVVGEVTDTEAEGIYQVTFAGRGGSVYAIASGEHFLVGDLYRLEDSGIVNVTEEAANGPRAELMASVKDEDMIIFSPKGEVKASVAVFTDVDCGYCRKLHQEVPALNDMGIEVKYLAYPRSGVGSESYKKIASAWCAEDPQDAITKLKAGQNIEINVCEGNPVADQFQLGIQAGLSGTPAIILDSGELIPGYMPAGQLAQRLGI